MAQFNNVRTDRFGRSFQLVSCKDKKGTGFSKGFITLKGQLYSVEPSVAKKDGVEYWVKITKLDRRTSNNM